jgi:hypothetical protein
MQCHTFLACMSAFHSAFYRKGVLSTVATVKVVYNNSFICLGRWINLFHQDKYANKTRRYGHYRLLALTLNYNSALLHNALTPSIKVT